jgi:small conductance mechanosensitive channel
MKELAQLDATELVAKLIGKLEGWVEAFFVMLPNVLLAALILGMGALVARFVQQGVQGVLIKTTGNQPISRMIGSLSRIAIVGMSALWALGLLHLDKTVTSMLAGVGVVGLALGFAFQDIAANFMAGFMMALNRPFEVGDLVKLADHQCRVLHVALRATEVETLDGLSILIPNKDIFQNPIINYTRTRQRRVDFSVGTAYADDMETVRRVVAKAVENVPDRDKSREVGVFFEGFGDSSINFLVHIWLDESSEMAFLKARSEAMIAIKRAFDENGITIPFPIRTLDFGAKVVGGTRLDALKVAWASGDR